MANRLERDRQVRKIYSFRPWPPHEGVKVDDLPSHSTCHDYAYEQENKQNNDNVLELGT